MTKQEKKDLRRFAFILAVSSYRRVVLTYYALKRAYFEKVLKRYDNLDENRLCYADYDYYINMFNAVNKDNISLTNLTILYASVCKCYAMRIKKYGVYT